MLLEKKVWWSLILFLQHHNKHWWYICWTCANEERVKQVRGKQLPSSSVGKGFDPKKCIDDKKPIIIITKMWQETRTRVKASSQCWCRRYKQRRLNVQAAHHSFSLVWQHVKHNYALGEPVGMLAVGMRTCMPPRCLDRPKVGSAIPVVCEIAAISQMRPRK